MDPPYGQSYSWYDTKALRVLILSILMRLSIETRITVFARLDKGLYLGVNPSQHYSPAVVGQSAIEGVALLAWFCRWSFPARSWGPALISGMPRRNDTVFRGF